MKSFISVIYAKANSFTDEKIAVGIIYFSNDEAKIIFSRKKVNIFEQLVTSEVSAFLESNFQLYENKIKELNTQLHKGELKNNILTKEYFEYLNKYSQGLLVFDKLKPVNLKVENKNTDQILWKFLGGKEDIKAGSNKKNSSHLKIKNNSFSIKPENVEGVLKPIKLLAGYFKEGKIKIFKKINFNKKNYYLINELYELKILKEMLSHKFNIFEKDIDINLLSVSGLNNMALKNINQLLSVNEFKVYLTKEELNSELEKIKKENYKELQDVLAVHLVSD